MLGERKDSKIRAMYIAFCHSKEDVTFKERTWGKKVEIYYLNGQNATLTLRVYSRNHGLCRGSYTVKAVQDSIVKFEETDSTCD